MTGRAGPYLLAIDAGTGSCRALLFTADGEQAAVVTAGVDAPRAAGRAWRPGLRRGCQLDGDRCLHPARAAAGGRRPAPTSQP